MSRHVDPRRLAVPEPVAPRSASDWVELLREAAEGWPAWSLERWLDRVERER